MTGPTRIGVALKWQSLRAEVDPLTGSARLDERFMGASAADCAALEWSLRIAEAWDASVLAVCAGPPGAESMLRDALAAGADGAELLRLDPDAGAEVTAQNLASALSPCAFVVCGDRSLDRGSGAVPALLADALGAAQALGLLGVEIAEDATVYARRRLDGGRRERLRVGAPAVLSVEGATARLRRATLSGIIRAQRQPVASSAAQVDGDHRLRPFKVSSYRPRARMLDPPDAALGARERVDRLTTGLSRRRARRAVRAEPREAAQLLIAALHEWGYLP